MISLPLLQKVIPTIKGGTEGESLITLVVILGVVALTVITSVISSKRSHHHKSSGVGKKFTKSSFIKKGVSLGLSKNEAQILTNLVVKREMKNPFLVFSSDNMLDTLLKDAIINIKRESESDAVAEAKIGTIFRIKQCLERKKDVSIKPMATTRLRAGQEVVVRVQNASRFKTKIFSNKNNAIYITTPSKNNKIIRIKNNTPIIVLFWRKNEQEYSFLSKVIGHKEINGVDCTLLQHTNKISETQNRKHKRKIVNIPIYFYPISFITVGLGRKAKKQAVVEENNGMSGTLISLSVGGCAITTEHPANLAELVKLQFDINKNVKIWCFGKVIRVNSNFGIDYTMHIGFTKISKKNLNEINSFIFDFDE